MGKEEGDGIQNTHENVRTTKFYKLLPFKTGNVLACMFAENNLSKKGKNELLQFIQFQFSYTNHNPTTFQLSLLINDEILNNIVI